MMKTAAVITAVAAVVLTAAAFDVDGEVRFVRALGESDRLRRGEALLELAERGAYPADLALVHLTRAQLPPKSAARLLPLARSRSGELIPAVLLLRAFRQDDPAARPQELTSQQLFDMAHTAWQKAAARELSPFEQGLFRELSGEVLKLAWERGEAARIFPEVEKRLAARGKDWDRDFPVSALLEFLYRHAFVTEGFELFSGQWHRSPSPARRIFATLLAEQAQHAPESDGEAAARVALLTDIGEKDAAVQLAAARMLARQDVESITRLIAAVVNSGGYAYFDKIRPLVKEAAVPFLYGETLARGGRYREALKQLPLVSDPGQRARLELLCRMGLGEFAAAAKLAEDPASPLERGERILALLTIAEWSCDRDVYRAAERLAGTSIDTDASLANAFGYVALLVTPDRDRAERRIRYALSVKPDESSYLDSLAWARHLAGDHAGAWKLMESALRRAEPQPENCELLAHAGAIRLALGDVAGARRYCEAGLKLALAGEKDPAAAVRFRPHVAKLKKMLERIK